MYPEYNLVTLRTSNHLYCCHQGPPMTAHFQPGSTQAAPAIFIKYPVLSSRTLSPSPATPVPATPKYLGMLFSWTWTLAVPSAEEALSPKSRLVVFQHIPP